MLTISQLTLRLYKKNELILGIEISSKNNPQSQDRPLPWNGHSPKSSKKTLPRLKDLKNDK